MRIGAEQEMPEFMRHGVTKNHQRRGMGFFLQLLVFYEPIILRASRGLKASTVGISFSAEDGKGCYADLFYEPIQQLQEETHASPPVVLGHAMAHELGHLLLGTNSHSPSGLMRAHWTGEDLTNASKGNLRFSQEQCLRIRSRLTKSEYGDVAPVEIAATNE